MTLPNHKVVSWVASVAFIVIVQIFASPLPIFRFLLPAFISFLAALGLYNFFYLKKVNKANIWIWLRPVLFFLSWFGLYFIVPNDILRGLFLLIGLPTGYWIENLLGNNGQFIIFNRVVIISFAGIMTIEALSSYYLVHSLVYLLTVFVFLTLLVRSFYESTPHLPSVKWTGTLLVSLLSTELFWVLSFLPFHYSALALMLFNLFYLIWSLNYYSLFNILTTRKIQYQVLITFVFIVLIILLSPWRVLVP